MATSLGTLSGTGILDFDKAEYLFSKRAKGRRYKVLSDAWTRLLITRDKEYVPEGEEFAFIVTMSQNVLFSIHRSGWRIWDPRNWDISSKNRLNAFVPANFYGNYGTLCVGSNNRWHKRGMFVDFTDKYKYPNRWSGWERWNTIPHSNNETFAYGQSSPTGYDSLSALRLSKLICHLYVHYYMDCLMQLASSMDCDWTDLRTVSNLSCDASISPSNSESVSELKIKDVSDFCSNMKGKNPHHSAVQGLVAVAGASCTSLDDGHGVPDSIDLFRWDNNYSSRMFYKWARGEGEKCQRVVYNEGVRVTLSHHRYELVRRNAIFDLVSYLAHGSMLHSETLVWPLPESGNSNNARYSFHAYNNGRYCVYEDDLLDGFRNNKDISNTNWDGRFQRKIDDEDGRNSQEREEDLDMRSRDAPYPRDFLLTILDLEDVDMDFLNELSLIDHHDDGHKAHFLEPTHPLGAYLREIMHSFFNKRMQSMIAPAFVHSTVLDNIAPEHQARNTWRHSASTPYSPEFEERVLSVHGIKRSDVF